MGEAVTVVFDPHRDITVATGAFSIDINELNGAHALVTYEKLLVIEPSKAALTYDDANSFASVWEGSSRQYIGAAVYPARHGQVVCHGRPRGRGVELPLS